MPANDEDYRDARKEFESRVLGILESQDKRMRDLELKVAILGTKLYTYGAVALGAMEIAKHYLIK